MSVIGISDSKFRIIGISDKCAPRCPWERVRRLSCKEPVLRRDEEKLTEAEMFRMFPGYSPRPVDKRGEHS
jgi:hypothetical protein